jgi:hypothetical protein
MERRYPDPDAVPYARLHPVGNPCQITSQVSGKLFPMHSHGAWIDQNGDGNTDVGSGHFHRVKGFRVLPDLTDGHTHDLTGLPCGAGAPNFEAVSPGQRIVTVRDWNGAEVQMMAPPEQRSSVWPWVVGGLVVIGVAAGLYFFLRDPEK